jgi:hypothetical protein
LRATIWFAAQMTSLVKPWMWGVLLGVALGAMNLISSAIAPLAEDTPLQLLAIGSVVLGSWVMTGFAAERRSHRFRDAVLAGVVIAVISSSLFGAANFARKMLFLDTIQYRSDWQGLLLRFYASDTHDLRAFVIDEHLRGMPGGLLFSVLLGAACGAFGGAYSSWRREAPRMDVT